MKRIILILTILTVGIVHSQAQIGAYYKTILDQNQQNIVETDSITIVVKKNTATIWYLFENGLCTETFYTAEGLTEDIIVKAINKNKTFKKSTLRDWWYYYVHADDNNRYHTIVRVWYNKNKVYQHIYLNTKL